MEQVEWKGRFAPSPSGRMHLGNLFAALLAWLDVASAGGTMVLRMEDLDPQRCRPEYAQQLAEDLTWLGLTWDEGYQKGGDQPPYEQSQCGGLYQQAFDRLDSLGLVYPCYCTRAQRLSVVAPHRGEQVDRGCPCKTMTAEEGRALQLAGRHPAWRVSVPEGAVAVEDGHLGRYQENMEDFFIRRADGVFAYQLAVTVDDGRMGVNRVVRGSDLLSSTPRQIWLHQQLGFTPPSYVHVPLLVSPDGRRLSKRDGDLDVGHLRRRYSPEELLGRLAQLAKLQDSARPISAAELVGDFSWAKVPKEDIVVENWP